jgi:hypothetical protein
MKVIELMLKKDKTGEGITAISLVKNPAIEQTWIAFSAGEKAKPDPRYEFKTIDEEKRILAGPAMIPDKLIYRQNEEGEEFWVFFKADTIRELSERFLLNGKQGSMTLEHEATLNDLSVVESWIVEDPEKDKSAMYGFDLPVGSWFVKVKVLNDEVWNLVKQKAVAGFSVEGVFTQELIKQSQQMKTTKLDEYLTKIRGLFSEESEKDTEETEEQTQENFGSVEATMADGTTVTINYAGEVLEVGAAITHTVEGEEQPVPTGEYTLSDGTVLVVTEDGVAGDLRPAEEDMKKDKDEEYSEEKVDDGGLKAEQIDKLIDGIAEIIANFKSEVRTDIQKAVKKSADSLRAEFNKPADDHEDETPEDKDRKAVVQGLSKFVRESKKE